jgi:hypothetical protein
MYAYYMSIVAVRAWIESSSSLSVTHSASAAMVDFSAPSKEGWLR